MDKALYLNDLFGLWFQVIKKKVGVVITGLIHLEEYGFRLADVLIGLWVI